MTKFVTLASDFVFREDCRYNFSTPTGNTQLNLRAARSNFVAVCQGKRVTRVSIQNPGGFRPTKRLNLGVYQKR